MVGNLVRIAIEKMYIGTCDVIERQKVTNPTTKRTSTQDVAVILGQPCRLSFSSSPSTSSGDVSATSQTIKLFIAPELDIRPGSKITITQNGRVESYQRSGEPAVYESHQEITLEKFERWA